MPKRPSIHVNSELIEQFLGTDFDQVSSIATRIAAVEAIIAQISDLPAAIAAANQIASLFTTIDSLYVAAPLGDNVVDYSGEGFTEETLGSFLAALAIITKANEAAIANDAINTASASTSEGTTYPPLGGNWDPALVNVKLVLDSLRGLFVRHGAIVIADEATQSTPISYTNTGNKEDLTNDGLGESNDTYAPDSITEIYNLLNDEFNFSELTLGDIITIRVDLNVTTTAANQEVELFLNVSEGEPEEKSIAITRQTFVSAGAYDNVVGEITLLIDNAAIISSPGHIQFRSGNNASIEVNNFTVFTNVKD